jgi:hypothetical protein
MAKHRAEDQPQRKSESQKTEVDRSKGQEYESANAREIAGSDLPPRGKGITYENI